MQLGGVTLTGRLECSEKSLFQYHFVHHESYVDWPGIEPVPWMRAAYNWPKANELHFPLQTDRATEEGLVWPCPECEDASEVATVWSKGQVQSVPNLRRAAGSRGKPWTMALRSA